MEAFDKDGNPIQGIFSQEELDAKIEEARQAAVTAAEEAAAEAARAAEANKDEMPEWAKDIKARVESLSSNQTLTYLNKVTTSLDADRRKDVETRYNSLTGYPETPEGLAKRSEDAYLLATGERYNAGTVDMSNLAAAGGGKTTVSSTASTESDKGIQAALGVTSEDITKYSKK